MNMIWRTIVPIVFLGSLPWWYYDIRIGWIGMLLNERISMRWLDVATLGLLAKAGWFFFRLARVTGSLVFTRLFRIGMLLSLSAAVCLGVAVILMFVFVPYVPSSFPPATPATWISMGIACAAPAVLVVTLASLVLSLFFEAPALKTVEPQAR